MPDGAGRFGQDFSGPVLLRGSHHRTSLTSTGLSPSVGRLSSPLRLRLDWLMWALQPPAAVAAGFGLFRVRSPLLAESLYCFLFLGVLRCFSSPRWPSRKNICPKADGFPHSDTCGSGLWCSSPQLFAALHVLHRLVMPRHPPYALFCFHLYDLHHPSAGKSQRAAMSVSLWCYLFKNNLDLNLSYLSAITTSKNTCRARTCLFVGGYQRCNRTASTHQPGTTYTIH